MTSYNIVASMKESTVVSEYIPEERSKNGAYQSEDALEKEFIRILQSQGYEYLKLDSEQEFIDNLRMQMERLNKIKLSDDEWQRFFNNTLANANEGIVEKTRKIQENHVQVLELDNGTAKNMYLIDKKNIHNNSLQVINQYENTGTRHTRYDVTILVNGLPLIHTELKRRGVAIREAFNQINRYQRDSFWSSHGFFEYVQIFIISNGTNTKYYSNTTRDSHVKENKKHSGKKSNSFEFTNYWADASNQIIPELIDFTKTFLARHSILSILTKFCIFTSDSELLVMRPYQIAATERILNRVEVATNYKKAGTINGGGYIWHTTGSGKTLTSFKAAQIASQMPDIDKVLFVVDRKDLDYQTIKEYDRFEKGAANGNTSTKVLQRQLENRNEHGVYHDYNIIVTTIQKLNVFIKNNKNHDIYDKHVVMIFDECHRSQFGDMHQAIVKKFKKYHLFGFTGTPIFKENALVGNNPSFSTTEQVFGEQLHTYTIVDAISDGNVLPFRIDFVNTIQSADTEDEDVYGINRELALADQRRISGIVSYVLEHFDQKTKRAFHYSVSSEAKRRLNGFNSLFATSSIDMAKRYYLEFNKQITELGRDLKVATIFSYSPNEEEPGGLLADESMDTNSLDKSSRDFLEDAIQDYNTMFGTNYDTSSQRFENYYKDVAMRVKNKEIDILIVVNMFLTGFDAKTLNTLWVDKNLKDHGLIQAFSRTNRILNSIKTYGNIISFRDLKEQTDKAISLFGDEDAGGVVLLRSYDDYYYGYDVDGNHNKGYKELIEEIIDVYPIGSVIVGEDQERNFINLFGLILRIRNILTSFDEFVDDRLISEIDLQDYQSMYLDIYDKHRGQSKPDQEIINDDLEFEIELVKQVEVNIDYILKIIADSRNQGEEDNKNIEIIDKAILSSTELRSKKSLIEKFIFDVNAVNDIEGAWHEFVKEQCKVELDELIGAHNLKEDKAKSFVMNSFKYGEIKTTGTVIDDLMPPMSRFGSSNRTDKKQTIIDTLIAFFERYYGLI